MINRICAVILNYNSSNETEKCIQYLVQQDYSMFDVIVVDNNSKIEDQEAVSKICSKYSVEFVQSDENRGFSAGNNIGLKAGKKRGAHWALVINPDVELRDSQYISKMMRILSTMDSDVVVAGSNVLLPNGKRQNPSREPYFLEELLWPVQAIRGKIDSKFTWYVSEDKTGFCEKLCGCCFFIKVDFLDKIKFLDENVFLYCEEPILSALVKKYNKKMLYVKELTAYHMHIESQKGDFSKRRELFFKSRCYYWKKYSGYSKIQQFLLRLFYRRR